MVSEKRLANGAVAGIEEERVAAALQALPIARDARDIAVLGAGNTFMQAAIRAALFAALFIISMEAVIAVARFGENVTPLWIASAVLAWALIAAPTRDWPLIAGLAALFHVLRAVYYGEQPATEAIYLLANVGGPLLCAALMRWRGAALTFEDRSSVFALLIIAGVVAPAASTAVIGVGTLVDPMRFEIEDLGVWFLSDALSYLVFLPVFRSLAKGGWRELLTPANRARTVLLIGFLIVLLAAEWVMPADWRRSFPTLLVPYLIFIVFELGQAGARAALAITTAGLLLYAIFGPNAVRPGMSMTDYIVSVQIYLAAVVACLLPLAAVLRERQKLYETASEALADAQAAWGGIIAAEAQYRLVADNTNEMILRVGLDGSILFASPACRALAKNPESLQRKTLADLVHPDDAATARAFLAKALAEGAVDHPHRMQFRLRNAADNWSLFDVSLTLVASGNHEPGEFIAVLQQVQ